MAPARERKAPPRAGPARSGGRKATRLRHGRAFSLEVPAPFDFALTVAKPAGWHWSTPKESFESGTLWTGVRVNGISAGLAMAADGRTVRIRAYTEEPLADGDAAELEAIVRDGLGADEDLAGFYAFAQGDPVLERATADHPGMRIGLLDDVFGSVALAILLQMAPMERSGEMMDSLLEIAGERVSFAGHVVTLWPRAETVAGTDPLLLRKEAKLGYRAERLAGAAQYLVAHPVSLRELAKVPEPEAMKVLMAIPGIGPYSAAIIFGQSEPPIDAWSVVIMSELYEHKTPVNSRQEIDRVRKMLSARWGKWSWLAFAYILNDLDNLAREYPLSRVT